MNLLRMTLISLFVFMAATVAGAQSVEIDILQQDANCEVSILSMERVMRISADEKERIFVISRRGKNEKKKIDWIRLNYVRVAFTEFRQFPQEKVTVAAGVVSDKEQGNLEFWVGSELRLIAYLKKNAQICFHVSVYELDNDAKGSS